MRFSTAVVFLGSAAFAAAATTTGPAASQSTCEAEYIVQACLASENAKVDACTGNDWVCLCQGYTNVLTCYNNCPNDQARFAVQNQVTSYCGAAAPILSASSASVAAAAATAGSSSAAAATGSSTAATTDSAATPTKSDATSSKASGTASEAKSSSTGAASGFTAPVGGVLAVVLGLVGML